MKKTLVIPFLLILLIIPAILTFLDVRFFYTQDHIFIARLQQISTALFSGQFPVRWAPDLRYGEPLFNFYAPLPYYLGALFTLFGFNFIWAAKILFILSMILSGLMMYLLCGKLFSQRAAFFATILYVYAPYRAVDIYVRGALSEAWAFVFFPLIFYTSLLLSEKPNLLRTSFLALSLGGLLLTHNITTLMFLPFLFLFWLYQIWKSKKWKLFLPFSGALILSLGLAAFFLLPAMFERQFIQTKYLVVGYFNFRAHFVAFSQFFSTFWGYGSSLWGRDDGMSFQVGLVHWGALGLTAILGIIFRKDKKLQGLLFILGLSFLFSIFLQHNKSAFVWEAIPLMAFIQFPWRFLTISIFLVSIIGGILIDYLKNVKFISKGNWFTILHLCLIASVIIINIQYFRPKDYVDDSFFDKFIKTETMHKGVDLTKDYLPIWVQTVDGERFEVPRAEKGEIEVSDMRKSSTIFSISVNVISDSLIEAPITYFPGWVVRVDDRIIPQNSPSKMGLIRFELPKGNYSVKIELKDTPIRTAGNIISIISILAILLIFKFRKRYINA